MTDRGYLREGCFADIVVFDEEETAAATPDQTSSFGISRVFINGVQVLNGDEIDANALKTSGKAIKIK